MGYITAGSGTITGANVTDGSLSADDLSAGTIERFDPTALTLEPVINGVYNGIGNRSVVTNTIMRLGQVVIKNSITVNKVSIVCNGVTVSGAIKVALFSESGATQLFTGQTASYTANYTVKIITLGAPVTIRPGIYYFAVLPVGTCNVDFNPWDTNITGDIQTVLSVVAGEPVIEGTLTVTADTIPATIDPTAITAQSLNTICFRLDN